MGTYVNFLQDDLYRAGTVDLVYFLQGRGERLQRVGNTHKLVYSDGAETHDSITIDGSRWYDHKNRVGGGPIQFMQNFYGLSFQESVIQLLGGHYSGEVKSSPAPKPKPDVKKAFVLPAAHSDMRRAFAYLTKQRYISQDIISSFAHDKKIYEEAAHHNIVFVGYDENGVPRQAHQRSSCSFGKTFRMTVEGSDTKYSFAHFGSNDRLYVFEAPIDMLSYITLCPQEWQENSYIAMNGVYESAVLKALEMHENLSEIHICTDNDIGGIEAADRLRDILRERGYKNISRELSENKDWNEDLKARNGAEFLSAVPHRRREIFMQLVWSLEYSALDPTRAAEYLTVNTNEQNYTTVARIALSTAAVLLSRDHGYPPTEIFDVLKNRVENNYKSYADKGSLDMRRNNLQRGLNSVLTALGNYPATAEQNKANAYALQELADSALRCEADEDFLKEQGEHPQQKMTM